MTPEIKAKVQEAAQDHANQVWPPSNPGNMQSKSDFIAGAEYRESLGTGGWVKADKIKDKIHNRKYCGRIIRNDIVDRYCQVFWDDVEKAFTNNLYPTIHEDNLEILDESAPSDKDAEIERLRGALMKIEAWELPVTGEFWDQEKTRPVSYEANYGSNGARDFIRQIARKALNTKEV